MNRNLGPRFAVASAIVAFGILGASLSISYEFTQQVMTLGCLMGVLAFIVGAIALAAAHILSYPNVD